MGVGDEHIFLIPPQEKEEKCCGLVEDKLDVDSGLVWWWNTRTESKVVVKLEIYRIHTYICTYLYQHVQPF